MDFLRRCCPSTSNVRLGCQYVLYCDRLGCVSDGSTFILCSLAAVHFPQWLLDRCCLFGSEFCQGLLSFDRFIRNDRRYRNFGLHCSGLFLPKPQPVSQQLLRSTKSMCCMRSVSSLQRRHRRILPNVLWSQQQSLCFGGITAQSSRIFCVSACSHSSAANLPSFRHTCFECESGHSCKCYN